MDKEKRKNVVIANQKRTNKPIPDHSLKICPICGHQELEWGVISDTYYRSKLLYIFSPGKPYAVKSLRCLNCDSIIQLKADRSLYSKQQRSTCLGIALSFLLFFGGIAACIFTISAFSS